MTEKNKRKLERKLRRQNMGKLWNGMYTRCTPTKRQKMDRLEKKHKGNI